MEYYTLLFKPLVLLNVYLKMIGNRLNVLKKFYYLFLEKVYIFYLQLC